MNLISDGCFCYFILKRNTCNAHVKPTEFVFFDETLSNFRHTIRVSFSISLLCFELYKYVMYWMHINLREKWIKFELYVFRIFKNIVEVKQFCIEISTKCNGISWFSKLIVKNAFNILNNCKTFNVNHLKLVIHLLAKMYDVASFQLVFICQFLSDALNIKIVELYVKKCFNCLVLRLRITRLLFCVHSAINQ